MKKSKMNRIFRTSGQKFRTLFRTFEKYKVLHAYENIMFTVSKLGRLGPFSTFLNSYAREGVYFYTYAHMHAHV